MSNRLNGVEVTPRSIGDIRTLTTTIRESIGINLTDRFPVIWFLERSMYGLNGFNWSVDDDLSDGMEACAFPNGCLENPGGPFIKVRPEVYDAAFAEDGRARFTLLHECGHIFLHQNVSALHRKAWQPTTQLPVYRNSEWQADVFAAELLMPPKSFIGRRSLLAYCRGMAVSHAAAKLQGKKLIQRNEIPVMRWLAA